MIEGLICGERIRAVDGGTVMFVTGDSIVVDLRLDRGFGMGYLV